MSPAQYSHVPSHELPEEGIDLALAEKGHHALPQHRSIRESNVSLAKAIGAVILSSVLASILSFTLSDWTRDLDLTCWNKHSSYSPATSQIDVSYRDVVFNGSLNYPSEYRGELNPDLDHAWDRLEKLRMMRITDAEFHASPYPLDSIKLPEEAGGGYMGAVDVIHQLHCLNFIRKAAYWNWDYYQSKSAEFTDSAGTVHKHFDHCMEMLRQTLMCHADTSLVTYRWVEGHSNPYPNFNVRHSCRNFDSIFEWALSRQVPVDVPRGVVKPQPGEKVWASPP